MKSRIGLQIAIAFIGLLSGLVVVGLLPRSRANSAPDPLGAAKVVVEQSYAAQMSAAPTLKGTKDPIGARPTDAGTPEPWPSGMFEEQEAPFPAAKYVISNRWQRDVGGQHVVVYAGALGPDASKGVLVVQRYSLDSSQVSTQEIPWRADSGPLRISSAVGDVLAISSSRGLTGHFNVDTASFTP